MSLSSIKSIPDTDKESLSPVTKPKPKELFMEIAEYLNRKNNFDKLWNGGEE